MDLAVYDDVMRASVAHDVDGVALPIDRQHCGPAIGRAPLDR
jgi:hypothetical protein